MPNFLVESQSPGTLSGVFEDDGETGHLYIYEEDGRGILKHLQIYNRASELNVDERDVQVVWSSRGDKCAVKIWGEMRGMIDLTNARECSAKLESRDSPPITDPEWLRGF